MPMTPQNVPPLITRLRQRLLQLQLMQSILAELFGSTPEAAPVASSSSIPSAPAGEIAIDFALDNNELRALGYQYDLRRYLLQSLYAWPSSFAMSLSDTGLASPLIYSGVRYDGEIPNFAQQAYSPNMTVLRSTTSITGAKYHTTAKPASRHFETSLAMFGQMITALLTIFNSNGNFLVSLSARFFWYFAVVCTAAGFFSSLYGLLLSSNCLDRLPFGGNPEAATRRLGLIASVATAFGFVGALCMSLPNSITLWVTAALACAACTPMISSIFKGNKDCVNPRAPV